MSSCSILFLLLSAAVVATRAAQPGCTNSSLCASHEATIQVGGTTREYVVVTPPAAVGTFAALIVGIHGWDQEDGWACQAMAQPYVTSLNVVFMCPQGAQGTGGMNTLTGWNTWEDGYAFITGYADYLNDDVAFITAATTQVLSEYSFEGNTAYAIGFSFGGEMAFRLACEASELFSGFGVVAERGPFASARTQSWQPWSSACATVPTKRPLFMAIGDEDLYWTAADIRGSFDNYATSVLGCAGPSTPTQVAQDVTCHRYTACANLPQATDDAEVCVYAGMNHIYPTVADAPQEYVGFPIAPSAAIGAQWPATPNAWALWRGEAPPPAYVPSQTDTTDPPSGGSSSSGGLSSGAAWAVGIGAALLGVIVLTGIFFLCKFRKTKQGKVGTAGGVSEAES